MSEWILISALIVAALVVIGLILTLLMFKKKKEGKFWSQNSLFVIVTNDNNGYLAVNTLEEGWKYLNFGEGPPIQTQIDNVSFAFNEEIKIEEWDP